MSRLVLSKMISILSGAIFLSAAGWCADRPNLTGSWQLNPSQCDPHFTRFAGLTWVIDQNEAGIHVEEIARRADGKKTKTDFSCTTDGKECAVPAKDQLEKKVSFWYNGAALVEMDYRGHNRETVVKKRMRLSEDGKLTHVELIPILGSEQAGKFVFEKQSSHSTSNPRAGQIREIMKTGEGKAKVEFVT